ncbi:hypothetical protein I546_3215 [Mycobacterium kansasii 732]|nr:hypothetical protein I546_3215 [Mycobacterium kansasii 732]
MAGLSDADLTSDENLATMCAECNSGLSKRSLPPHLIAAAIWAHRRLHQGQRSPHPA